MFTREKTRRIKIGNITIGGKNKVLIQSMCTYKTSQVNKVIKQIKVCQELGASLMRVSVLDEKDALAIKKIKQSIDIPLVADIHFNHQLAIKAIKCGADKIRINPGNYPNIEDLKELIDLARKHNVAIRIGVNSGSLNKTQLTGDLATDLVEAALKFIKVFEEHKFYNLVISLKDSDPVVAKDAYLKIAHLTDYPLHIGITESGFDEIGIIRSCAGLVPLLERGIGDTIRISLSQDPLKEILTCKRLLHDLGLYSNYPTIISCPTCGRIQVKNIKTYASLVLDYLEKNNKNIKVAIMGCVVNGVGEGEKADLGIAGGNQKFVIFKNGQILKSVDEKDVLTELFKEIDKY